MIKRVQLPLTPQAIKRLKAGEEVLLSGTVYTARDQAHLRLVRALKAGKKLPFRLKDAAIYYCGPTPAPPGRVIGSCGPTTSSRMDPFTPALLAAGVKAMIGKGKRGEEVVKAIKKHRSIYFMSIGGAGALLSESVKSAKVVAYRELGPEAVRKLELANFPAIVGVDSRGRRIF